VALGCTAEAFLKSLRSEINDRAKRDSTLQGTKTIINRISDALTIANYEIQRGFRL
jgi:hypothetical protein